MKIGDSVAWQWANGLAQGTIQSIHHETVEIVSNGKTIRRHGSKDDPALVINHKSGNDVLKLAHEVQETSKESHGGS